MHCVAFYGTFTYIVIKTRKIEQTKCAGTVLAFKRWLKICPDTISRIPISNVDIQFFLPTTLVAWVTFKAIYKSVQGLIEVTWGPLKQSLYQYHCGIEVTSDGSNLKSALEFVDPRNTNPHLIHCQN